MSDDTLKKILNITNSISCIEATAADARSMPTKQKLHDLKKELDNLLILYAAEEDGNIQQQEKTNE